MFRLRHVFTTTGAVLLSGALGLLLTLVAAKTLTPTQNGHFAQFVLIFNLYFILFNFGLGPASTYFISSGQIDVRKMTKINIRVVGLVGVASLMLVLLLGMGNFWFWMEEHFKIPKEIFFSGLVAGFFLFVFNQSVAIITGKKHFDTVNLLNLLKAGLPFPAIGLAIIVLLDEKGFAFATTLALGTSSVIGAWCVWRTIRDAPSESQETAGRDHSILRYGGLAYASNVMHYLAMRGLLLILSYYCAPEYVGFFSIAIVFLETFLVIPSVVGQLAFPHSSSSQFNYELTDSIMRLNVYVGLLMAAMIIFISPSLIGLILGEEYQQVAIAIVHLTPSILLLAIPRILSQVLSGRGHPEYPLLAAILSFFLGGGIAFWLIPAYGIAGAAWVTNFVSAVTAGVTVYGYTRLRSVGVADVFYPRRSDFNFVASAVRRIVSHQAR